MFFQFHHILIEVRHEQSVLNHTILFKFSLCFCLGNLCCDLTCILKNLSVICHQKQIQTLCPVLHGHRNVTLCTILCQIQICRNNTL